MVVLGGSYAVGLLRLRRSGRHWPLLSTLGFYALGLGSYAWVSFGFLGAYSMELRWAFTTRIALLLFAVPALLALGRPIELLRATLSTGSLRVADRVLASRPIRFMGNAVFAPMIALAAFLVFLTPIAFVLRSSPAASELISVLVPFSGLLMVLPIVGAGMIRTSLFITAEFLLAFVELLMDAIPGIVLRINDGVLDGATAVLRGMPGWWPNPLHDQHLSGDFLWFIAEVSDVPILIVLFLRWMRTDKRESEAMDELSDEEMAALTEAHLRRRADVQPRPGP